MNPVTVRIAVAILLPSLVLNPALAQGWGNASRVQCSGASMERVYQDQALTLAMRQFTPSLRTQAAVDQRQDESRRVRQVSTHPVPVHRATGGLLGAIPNRIYEWFRYEFSVSERDIQRHLAPIVEWFFFVWVPTTAVIIGSYASFYQRLWRSDNLREFFSNPTREWLSLGVISLVSTGVVLVIFAALFATPLTHPKVIEYSRKFLDHLPSPADRPFRWKWDQHGRRPHFVPIFERGLLYAVGGFFMPLAMLWATSDPVSIHSIQTGIIMASVLAFISASIVSALWAYVFHSMFTRQAQTWGGLVTTAGVSDSSDPMRTAAEQYADAVEHGDRKAARRIAVRLAADEDVAFLNPLRNVLKNVDLWLDDYSAQKQAILDAYDASLERFLGSVKGGIWVGAQLELPVKERRLKQMTGLFCEMAQHVISISFRRVHESPFTSDRDLREQLGKILQAADLAGQQAARDVVGHYNAHAQRSLTRPLAMVRFTNGFRPPSVHATDTDEIILGMGLLPIPALLSLWDALRKAWSASRPVIRSFLHAA